jgi:hypothetical protein
LPVFSRRIGLLLPWKKKKDIQQIADEVIGAHNFGLHQTVGVEIINIVDELTRGKKSLSQRSSRVSSITQNSHTMELVSDHNLFPLRLE